MTVRAMLDAGLAAVRARLWLVLVVTLVVSGGLIARDRISPSSEARVLIAFAPGNIIQSVFNEPRQSQPPPTAGELKSFRVLRTLGEQVSVRPQVLDGQLSVEQVAGNEREATLVARAATPARATAIVNQWATVYTAYRREVLGNALFAARREVRSRAQKLLKEANQFQRGEILRALLAVEAARFDPTDTSVVAFQGTSTIALPVVLALLIGLCAGGGLALLAALFDGRLRTAAASEAQIGQPVVAELPEGLATLRNRLFATVGASAPRMTLLTGFDSSDGAAAVGRELAKALSSEGRSTALVIDAAVHPAAPGGIGDGLVLVESAGEVDYAVFSPAGDAGMVPEAWLTALVGLRDRHETLIVAAGNWDTASALAAAPDADAWLYVVVSGDTPAAAAREAASAVAPLDAGPVGVVMVTRRWVAAQAPALTAGASGDPASEPKPERRRLGLPRRRKPPPETPVEGQADLRGERSSSAETAPKHSPANSDSRGLVNTKSVRTGAVKAKDQARERTS